MPVAGVLDSRVVGERLALEQALLQALLVFRRLRRVGSARPLTAVDLDFLSLFNFQKNKENAGTERRWAWLTLAEPGHLLPWIWTFCVLFQFFQN